MLSLIFLAFVVAVKVYKKTTPNGKFLVGLLLITQLPVFELIVPFLISLKNNISIFLLECFILRVLGRQITTEAIKVPTYCNQ